MKWFRFAALTLFASFLSACHEKGVEPGPSAPANNRPISGSPNVQFYLVRGVVKTVEPQEKSVTIQHEEIPKYMAAMTMPFKVKDGKELDGLQSGDTVWFRLWVSPGESWIDKLKTEMRPDQSPPRANASAEREAVRVARDVEPLNVGDVMPAYTFTNELGRAVNLSDFHGQALAFTFIFTRCPLPDFCPRMSRNFFEVNQKLTAMPNGPANWHLLTISFDPHNDTPAVLLAYAQAFQYDPKHWNFVSGAMIDIDAITDQFNLTIVKRGNEWDHKVRTVVIDAAGRVQKILYGNEWKPDALVEEMVKAAMATAKPPVSADKPAAAQ